MGQLPRRTIVLRNKTPPLRIPKSSCLEAEAEEVEQYERDNFQEDPSYLDTSVNSAQELEVAARHNMETIFH